LLKPEETMRAPWIDLLRLCFALALVGGCGGRTRTDSQAGPFPNSSTATGTDTGSSVDTATGVAMTAWSASTGTEADSEGDVGVMTVSATAVDVNPFSTGSATAVFSGQTASATSTSVVPYGSPLCTIYATDYDQTCAQDADCVAIVEGFALCTGMCWCPNATIRASEEGRYLSNLAQIEAQASAFGCSCPPVSPPICRLGLCILEPGSLAMLNDASVDASADGGGEDAPAAPPDASPVDATSLDATEPE